VKTYWFGILGVEAEDIKSAVGKAWISSIRGSDCGVISVVIIHGD
jgi:hypothetical protein